MNGRNTFSEAPASPEQILAIFQDWQRLELGRAPKESELLSFETTVGELLDFADFLNWKMLGKGLNKFFETNFSAKELSVAIKPENKKTLRDVCALISSRATLPLLNKAGYLGGSCKTASAFLVLREKLQGAGIEVSKIRPSSELSSFSKLHLQKIIETILKLAPGGVPKIHIRAHVAHRFLGLVCLGCLVSLIISEIFGAHFVSAVSCAALMVSFCGLTVTSHLPPAEVQFEGMGTFADLCRAIAVQNAGGHSNK